jgi:capsular exopolysaccharide synthesis family protein
MTSADHTQDSALTLRDYLQVAKRRKWIILTAVVLVPAVAIAFSLHQTKLYQASAQVLLNTQNLAQQLNGVAQSGTYEPQTEIVQTQALVARAPAAATRALSLVGGTGLTPAELLAESSVSVPANADLLTFSVTDHSPALASQLVNAYAKAYTLYRRQLDTASVKGALRSLHARLYQLRHTGQGTSGLAASLAEQQQKLQTIEALQTSNATVVQEASGATQTQPNPTRNAILGLMLGVLLGIGLAFLREALDTRVRSAAEIGERLGRPPLLAQIPAPPKRFADQKRLAMVDEPYGPHAEVFRILRTNLEFVSLGHDVKTVMITSAVEQEGKSTTIANLAVALARSGKRVTLVDLDLRRPMLDRLFGVESPGLTAVALGHASLDQALVRVVLTEPATAVANGAANGKGRQQINGVLDVLPSGSIPPDPGEFVGTAKLTEILMQLRERSDIVLLDTPPVLPVGDSLTLSARVDGIIVTANARIVRRNTLSELGRRLATAPAPILGYVVAAAGEESGYGYGYGDGYGSYASAQAPAAFKRAEGEPAESGV